MKVGCFFSVVDLLLEYKMSLTFHIFTSCTNKCDKVKGTTTKIIPPRHAATDGSEQNQSARNERHQTLKQKRLSRRDGAGVEAQEGSDFT